MNNSFINVQQVTMRMAHASAGHKVVLNAADAIIGQGHAVTITGANGSGKSTLLRLLTGLLRPNSGKIIINHLSWQNAKMAQRLRAIIGYAPDTPPLYANDTVAGYLRFIAQLKKIPAGKITVRVNDMLELFDLTSMRSHYIHSLSKGMQQRLNLAQALIHDPQLLILDEPTNGLDPDHCAKFLQHLNLLRQQQVTIIFASHIYTDFLEHCDYMLKVEAGKLQQIMLPSNVKQVNHVNHQLDYTT